VGDTVFPIQRNEVLDKCVKRGIKKKLPGEKEKSLKKRCATYPPRRRDIRWEDTRQKVRGTCVKKARENEKKKSLPQGGESCRQREARLYKVTWVEWVQTKSGGDSERESRARVGSISGGEDRTA